TSIWRPESWNRWKTHSAQKCYPCDRYILLPMSPERTLIRMVAGVDLNHRPLGYEGKSMRYARQRQAESPHKHLVFRAEFSAALGWFSTQFPHITRTLLFPASSSPSVFEPSGHCVLSLWE